MTNDLTNMAGFERWAATQHLHLEHSGKLYPDRTYRAILTEYAWRGWVNRPHRETRVETVSHWPSPVQAHGVMGIPPNPPGSGIAKIGDPLPLIPPGTRSFGHVESKPSGAPVWNDPSATVARHAGMSPPVAPPDAMDRAFEPLPQDAYHGMPPFPAVTSVETAQVHARERIAITEAAVRASIAVKDLIVEPPLASYRVIDDGEVAGCVPLVNDKTIEACKARFAPNEAFKVGPWGKPWTRSLPTLTINCMPRNIEKVEWLGQDHLGIHLSEDPLVEAVKALLSKLPDGMHNLVGFARDELTVVRKLLEGR